VEIEEFIAGLPFGFWVGLGGVCVVVIVVGLFALLRDREPGFQLMMICPHCGSEGMPKVEMPGSALVQFCLVLTFVVPGVFYALWRESAKKRVCPVCGATGVVPSSSPRGVELRRQLQKSGAEPPQSKG